jgi:hypothetical protein
VKFFTKIIFPGRGFAAAVSEVPEVPSELISKCRFLYSGYFTEGKKEKEKKKDKIL